MLSGKSYSYNDAMNNHNTVMTYESQKKWRCNDILLKDPNVDCYVFHRKSSRMPFSFVGKVVSRDVEDERTYTTPLKMRFRLDTCCTEICSMNKVFAPIPFKCFGKYKMGVFQDIGARPVKNNAAQTGIVLVDL